LVCEIVPIPIDFDPADANRLPVGIESLAAYRLRQAEASLPKNNLHPVEVATFSTVVQNQVVCLMGYPQGESLSIDWGRVEKSDSSEILVNVISESGSSGGPLFDRDGKVLGLLSRSFDHDKYSSVEPLRGIVGILRRQFFSIPMN
jgi:hypothetical protein